MTFGGCNAGVNCAVVVPMMPAGRDRILRALLRSMKDSVIASRIEEGDRVHGMLLPALLQPLLLDPGLDLGTTSSMVRRSWSSSSSEM